MGGGKEKHGSEESHDKGFLSYFRRRKLTMGGGKEKHGEESHDKGHPSQPAPGHGGKPGHGGMDSTLVGGAAAYGAHHLTSHGGHGSHGCTGFHM